MQAAAGRSWPSTTAPEIAVVRRVITICTSSIASVPEMRRPVSETSWPSRSTCLSIQPAGSRPHLQHERPADTGQLEGPLRTEHPGARGGQPDGQRAAHRDGAHPERCGRHLRHRTIVGHHHPGHGAAPAHHDREAVDVGAGHREQAAAPFPVRRSPGSCASRPGGSRQAPRFRARSSRPGEPPRCLSCPLIRPRARSVRRAPAARGRPPPRRARGRVRRAESRSPLRRRRSRVPDGHRFGGPHILRPGVVGRRQVECGGGRRRRRAHVVGARRQTRNPVLTDVVGRHRSAHRNQRAPTLRVAGAERHHWQVGGRLTQVVEHAAGDDAAPRHRDVDVVRDGPLTDVNLRAGGERASLAVLHGRVRHFRHRHDVAPGRQAGDLVSAPNSFVTADRGDVSAGDRTVTLARRSGAPLWAAVTVPRITPLPSCAGGPLRVAPDIACEPACGDWADAIGIRMEIATPAMNAGRDGICTATSRRGTRVLASTWPPRPAPRHRSGTFAPASDAAPIMLPRPIVSTADDGTMIIEPLSVPQTLVHHVHRAQVQGDGVVLVVLRGLRELLGDLGLGRAEDDARLCRSRSACAWRDIASSRAAGMMYVADLHGLGRDPPRRGPYLVQHRLDLVGRAARAGTAASPGRSCRSRCAGPSEPTGSPPRGTSSTSRTASCASQTIQNAIASTFTGTVSAVRVVSALKSVTRMRWSTNSATLSSDRDDVEEARTPEPAVASEPEDRRLLPLRGHLQREERSTRRSRPARPRTIGRPEQPATARRRRSRRQDQQGDADVARSRSGRPPRPRPGETEFSDGIMNASSVR